jgi:hypothetical protein
MTADTPTSALKTASPPQHWQFRLWHLFGLMTYVAVMLGVATWQGPPTLMVTLGLGVAILSHLGAFERLQQGRTQLVLVGIAWVTYLVSLCTPCTTGTFTVFGWQAAWTYLAGPFAALFSLERNFDIQLHAWPWVTSVDLANVLQAALPLLMWRLSRNRGKVLSVLICLAIVGPWTTLVMANGLFVAYYIWCISFMLVVMAVPVNRWTLLSMAGLSALQIAIFKTYSDMP